jgi:hypothetical protein
MKTASEWLSLICGDQSPHLNRHSETVYDDCPTCQERVESIQMDARLDGYQAGFRDAVEAAAKVAEADEHAFTACGIRNLKPDWEQKSGAEGTLACPGCEVLRRKIAEKEKWLCRWLHSFRGSMSEDLAAVIKAEESLRHSEKCIDPIIKEMWDRGVRP